MTMLEVNGPFLSERLVSSLSDPVRLAKGRILLE